VKPPHPYDAGFVLNVRKPAGWTSHDAVQRLRRILHYRRIGHTGTLDPFATGVLLCCVGRATKLSNYLMDLTKEYAGTMLFGRRTSTGDIAGEVLEDSCPPVPERVQLEQAARAFEGDIMQVPPMISALKHEGRRLYQLARAGVTVERRPRRVHVEQFAIEAVAGQRIRFRVRCARGTYVRTLVEDYGTRLGATACVAELCRTRVGPFAVDAALGVEGEVEAGTLTASAIPMAAALEHLPRWRVPGFWVRKLRDGQAPPWLVIDLETQPQAGETGRLVGPEDELIALGRADVQPGRADRPWYDTLELQILRVL